MFNVFLWTFKLAVLATLMASTSGAANVATREGSKLNPDLNTCYTLSFKQTHQGKEYEFFLDSEWDYYNQAGKLVLAAYNRAEVESNTDKGVRFRFPRGDGGPVVTQAHNEHYFSAYHWDFSLFDTVSSDPSSYRWWLAKPQDLDGLRLRAYPNATAGDDQLDLYQRPVTSGKDWGNVSDKPAYVGFKVADWKKPGKIVTAPMEFQWPGMTWTFKPINCLVKA